MGASVHISHGIPWRAANGRCLPPASKSFNIPALTGAWGMIGDATSRENWLDALKNSNGLSSPAVLSVVAHIAAYRQGAPWLDALRTYLRANLEYIASRLNQAFPKLNWQASRKQPIWPGSICAALKMDDRCAAKGADRGAKSRHHAGDIYGAEGQGFIRLNAGCPRIKLERGVEGLIAALTSLM